MRVIDADAVELRAEKFERLTGTKLDIVHDFVSSAPTVDAIPVAYIESEKQRVNAMVVEEAKAGNIKEADRLSTIMAVMDAIVSNWRYTTGNDWRTENETD